MEKTEFCGSNFEVPIPPFSKIICLGYYDGPTSGLALCAKSEMVYRFKIAAWDLNGENRIYSLSETQLSTFDSIVKILTQIEGPHWPVWVPRWQFDSAVEEKHLSDQIDRIFMGICPADRVIASDELDKQIIAYRELEADAAKRLPQGEALPDPSEWEFWREYLRLEKK